MSDINIVLENRDDIRVAVEEKDINVEVPAGKDGRSLRPRGEWSASAAYAYLDLVSYQGSSYVATKSVPAGTLPTDTSYWMLSAEKGDPGTPVWGGISGDLSDQTDLQTALDAKADVIISSASGSIASFSDGSPAPVTALSVSIEPVQAGTGDPSPTNVRPISGHTSAVVTRTGKSLLEPAMNITTKNGVTFTQNSDGTITTSGAPTANFSGTYPVPISTAKMSTLKPGTYRLSGCPSGGGSSTYKLSVWNQSASSQLAVDYGSGVTFIIPETSHSYYVRITIYKDVDVTGFVWKPMITKVEDDITYEPYQAQQVTIDLNGTRYGGTLNVLTGMLTVTHKLKECDGTETWATIGTNNRYGLQTAQLPDALMDNSLYLKCSHYKSVTRLEIGTTDKSCCIDANNVAPIVIRDTSFANVTDFKTYLAAQKTAGNPVTVVYPIATPITVQLTPSQLSTLLGTNNIWADTGDVSVTYRADTKLYIDGVASATAKVTRQMIADSATADGKAPKSLATGDLIIVGDELRKATANIGNGSAITASNSTTATLADVIKALQ